MEVLSQQNSNPQHHQTSEEDYQKKKIRLSTLNIIAFSHDHFMLRLPQDNVRLSFGKEYLYEDFPFYQNLLNYRGQKVLQVPVIRLFGANKYGQKCCLNVHNYFPYFYIKADKIEHLFDLSNKASVKSFLDDFCMKVEESFTKIYSQNNQKNQYPNQAQKYAPYRYIQQIIHKAEIVFKKDFYGYHAEDQPFIKIIHYNPSHAKKIKDILITGVIMNLKFQVYDGHINYYMHFYSDNYIYGMKEVYALNYKFRKDYSQNSADVFQKISLKQIAKGEIRESLYKYDFDLLEMYELFPEYFSRQQKSSTCYIEADVECKNLINYIYHCEKDEEDDEDDDKDIQQSNISNSQNTSAMPSLDKNPFLKYTHFERGKMLNFEFTVQITKAIKELWYEETMRRQMYKINAPISVRISLENNIEGQLEFRKGTCDIYNSVNQMNDQKIRSQFNQHVLQYFQKSQNQGFKPETMFINSGVIQNFFKSKQQQKSEISQKVISKQKSKSVFFVLI